MSDKNYNLENFEETIVYGKHFKEDIDDNLSSKDDFDFDEKTVVIPDIKKVPPVRPVATPQTKSQDYGDEYYNNSDDDFVPQVINPYPKYKEQAVRKPAPQQNYKDEQIKRKNNTIVILTVALVLVVFISLLFVLVTSLAKNNNNNNSDNNDLTPTNSVTLPTDSKTEAPTEEETEEPTEEETEEPTEEETEEKTEEPTEAPTEIETETPTDAPVDIPVE